MTGLPVQGGPRSALARPLVLPPGRCLTDIWDHLTPRRKSQWIAQVEAEIAEPRPWATYFGVEGGDPATWPRDQSGRWVFTLDEQREGTRWYRRWVLAGRPGEWPHLLREAYLEHARTRHHQCRVHLAASRSVSLTRPR